MISGTQRALMPARLNVLRLGASRLGFIGHGLFISIGEVELGKAHVLRIAGLQIVDHLDGEPNLATMRVSGFASAFVPAAGMEIKIGLGTLEPAQLIFAGHLQTVQQLYEADRPVNVAYDVTAMSYEWLLNRQLVTWRYVNQSATAIAQDLIARFTGDGFTADRVAVGLPVLDELTFNAARVSDAFDTLARRIGGYWYVDYGRSLQLFITPPESAHPITNAAVHSAHDIAFRTDVSAARTRIVVQGAGSRTTSPVAIGGTLVPVESTAPFSASGGVLLEGTTRLTYSGRVLGGVGSNVASLGGPGAPVLALQSGAGGVQGVVRYRVTWRTSQGETAAGTPSAPLDAPAAAAPSGMTTPSAVVGGPIVGTVHYVRTYTTKYGETTPSGSAAFTGVGVANPGGLSVAVLPAPGRLIGTYRYALTYSTADGETLLGTEASPATAVAFPTPTAPAVALAGTGPLIGAYGYKVTHLTALGETVASVSVSRTAIAFGPVPDAATLTALFVIGPLIGTYSYRVSYVTSAGETLLGATSTLAVAAHAAGAPGAIELSTVGPLVGGYRWIISWVSDRGESISGTVGTGTATAIKASAPTVTGDGIGSEIAYAVAYYHPQYGISEMSNRTVDTNKGTNPVVTVNGLPAGCGAFIYCTGTVASGQGPTAPLFKVAELEIGDASFTHTTEQGPSAGATPGTMGHVWRVTGIGAGPAGTTARRVYRTKANATSGPYFLVGQVDGNADNATFDDGVLDASLTVTAPTSNPNGKAIQLYLLLGGPTGTIARRLYRTRAGGSEYFRIGQIDGNAAGVVYTDTTPDSALTVSAPAVGTAGGQAHALTIATGPAGTIARRLYRTEANRTVYKLLAELPNNVDTAFTDTYTDGELGQVTEPVQGTAGGQNIQLSSIPLGPGGAAQALLTARTVYRTAANGAAFYQLRRFTDTTTAFVDDVLDDALGDPAPLSHTAGGYSASLPAPAGPAGITGTRFYRTVIGGSSSGPFLLVGHYNKNDGGSIVDSKSDDELGADQPPTVSDAGGSIVAVSSIATGPAGVTARRLYRTKGGGADYFFVAQLSDNGTTTFVDDNGDEALHDLAPTEGGVGALVGDTSLTVLSAAAFPTGGGWCRVESQVIRYAAISGQTLTGIPAFGVGAIVAAIRAGAAVVVEPQLTGVAGITTDMPDGTTLALLVTRNDAAAQAALAAMIGGAHGGTGIFEEYIADDPLSQAEAEERGDAKLLELKDPIRTVEYRTRDITTRSGRLITFALGAPTNLNGSFKIQQVTMTDFDPLNRLPPLRTVIASSRRERFEALVRMMKRQAV